MKKVLAIILAAIMILSFAACGRDETQEFNKDETGAENEKNENNIGTTYPILFFENDILYYLKNANESPLFVYEKQDKGAGLLGIFTNPKDPNLVVCVKELPDGYFDQYYLNTAPYPEYITFTNVELFRHRNYTPDGKFFYFVDNKWNMEFYEAQTKENFECAFTIDDIYTIDEYFILFEENSSKFYYVSFEEETPYISLADANAGYKKRIMDLSYFEDFSLSNFKFDYFKDNKIYFTHKNIQYELNVVTEEIKEVNKVVNGVWENWVWWNDGTLICMESADSEGYTEYLDFGGAIIKYDRTYDIFSGDYTNLFKLQNGNYVLQYTDSDKIANLCYYDGKNIKTLMKDNNYYFIQPLNNSELLLFETDPSGMNNLVVYEIETGNISVIYKNFKGDKNNVVVTYDCYKVISYDESNLQIW